MNKKTSISVLVMTLLLLALLAACGPSEYTNVKTDSAWWETGYTVFEYQKERGSCLLRSDSGICLIRDYDYEWNVIGSQNVVTGTERTVVLKDSDCDQNIPKDPKVSDRYCVPYETYFFQFTQEDRTVQVEVSEEEWLRHEPNNKYNIRYGYPYWELADLEE